ncbi:30S ribosomal protein S9 [Thermus scotoductus]|jgi:small subunit ribosomal protein S9|uniref:Small ribosomal subunit protein uS9 n=1 Tax=Thermus scotoductus TaxID=37636 RepID=A0A430R852_THESC|nr:30S ribosomal protein S9 [Thermus scotoductus]RTG96678.1 30S ribosomal protein S9 [Thermus scotoductus]RTG97040.1 30S ribosomal protein S9 [Thermus scotoductus]RTH03538.1 30S ribosomal protein S9 [Thermus scotoductus]RTH12310.1 30S ribosomal protein S9 [Thermus scotoductus]RTH13383.1 30S ribosomal protein S9 [Thermus scotoductus]
MEQYYGTGRRKEAVARVFLRPGSGKVTVNGQDFQDYFQGLVRAVAALDPLRAVDALGRFDAYITVKGGGKSGQVDAIKLGVARALLQYNPDYRAKLKPLGFLTRDARVVERKKYGKHKARRAPQYSKR